MYFEAPPQNQRIAGGAGYASGLVLSALGTVALGITPGIIVPASVAAQLLR